MQIVFQDPYASLDPRETAGAAVRAGLDLHGIGSPAEREARVAQLFKQVGLAPEMMRRWPHEFSGGQRQRLGIARALALQPRLLVCDEPVSALDVSIQAQILNLLKSLQQQMGLTLLFVSHNLAVVEHMSDRVAVMYAGRIVEQASRDALFAHPRHPYTLALLAAVPTPRPRQRGMALARKVGAQEIKVNGGCGFAGRCPQAQAKCLSAEPPLNSIAPSHQVACWATPSGD